MSGLIVHEWLARHGGSENVVERFLEAFPNADLHVLWSDREYVPAKLTETWLARTILRQHKAASLPFQLPTWRALRAESEYDWMLVSSHLFAHHARVVGQAHLRKLVYAHTPARYIWDPDLDRRGNSFLVRTASSVLRPIDRKRAQEAAAITANSKFTRDRIRRAWNRDAEVIYPPVDVERIRSVADWVGELNDHDLRVVNDLPDNFLLGASRMVPYKNLDLVIEAGVASGLPVVIAGSGPLWAKLAELAAAAKVPVIMIQRPSDSLLFALYQKCLAYVFPAIEDFGIMPVEAMAAGAPVIVPRFGGAAESASIVEGGVAVDVFQAAEWRDAVDRVQSVDRAGLPERSQRFSNAKFISQIQRWVSLEVEKR